MSDTVEIRRATYADAAIMLKWQSDPRTRKYAHNPAAPTKEEHEAWLKDYIDNNRGVLAIILHNKEPSGILRIDDVGSGSRGRVSIIVAPEKYRQGIATRALAAAVEYSPIPLFAEVLPDNEASHGLFQKAGWRMEYVHAGYGKMMEELKW